MTDRGKRHGNTAVPVAEESRNPAFMNVLRLTRGRRGVGIRRKVDEMRKILHLIQILISRESTREL